MSITRRRFSQELKDEQYREVTSTSKTIKTVADEYGVGASGAAELVEDVAFRGRRH